MLSKNTINRLKNVLIGAIDQSTTGTKFVVFNGLGNIVEMDYCLHEQITKKPGWLEHDPYQIKTNVEKVMLNVFNKLVQKKYDLSNFKGIGITNQRETVVAWNKNTGEPYSNAIVWNDNRTYDICQKYIKKFDNNQNYFLHKTGLPINTYFSGFKIRWLLDNIPEISRELDSNVLFGTMDSWLIWNLTRGLHVTDVTNASRTFLMNLNTLQYDQELLDIFGVPTQCLPEIRSSSEIYGNIDKGPFQGVPIAADLGDQQAASVGHGVFQEGNSKNTYGTGCFFQVNTGKKPIFTDKGLLTTVLFKLGQNADTYFAFEGAVESGGSTINWVKDKLQLYKDFDDLNKQISSVHDSQGVFFVPTLSGVYTPYWREATGTIIGLSLHSSKQHILRALLEGIAYRIKDVVNCVEQVTGKSIDTVKVDGGVTKSQALMRFQSDILQKPILFTKVKDSTCLGVAFAAGLSTGVYESLKEIEQLIGIEKQITPNYEFAQEAQNRYGQWNKAIERSFNWK